MQPFRVLGYTFETGWVLLDTFRTQGAARAHAFGVSRGYEQVAVVLVRDPANHPHLELLQATGARPERLVDLPEFRRAADPIREGQS